MQHFYDAWVAAGKAEDMVWAPVLAGYVESENLTPLLDSESVVVRNRLARSRKSRPSSDGVDHKFRRKTS